MLVIQRRSRSPMFGFDGGYFLGRYLFLRCELWMSHERAPQQPPANIAPPLFLATDLINFTSIASKETTLLTFSTNNQTLPSTFHTRNQNEAFDSIVVVRHSPFLLQGASVQLNRTTILWCGRLLSNALPFCFGQGRSRPAVGRPPAVV